MTIRLLGRLTAGLLLVASSVGLAAVSALWLRSYAADDRAEWYARDMMMDARSGRYAVHGQAWSSRGQVVVMVSRESFAPRPGVAAWQRRAGDTTIWTFNLRGDREWLPDEMRACLRELRWGFGRARTVERQELTAPQWAGLVETVHNVVAVPYWAAAGALAVAPAITTWRRVRRRQTKRSRAFAERGRRRLVGCAGGAMAGLSLVTGCVVAALWVLSQFASVTFNARQDGEVEVGVGRSRRSEWETLSYAAVQTFRHEIAVNWRSPEGPVPRIWGPRPAEVTLTLNDPCSWGPVSYWTSGVRPVRVMGLEWVRWPVRPRARQAPELLAGEMGPTRILPGVGWTETLVAIPYWMMLLPTLVPPALWIRARRRRLRAERRAAAGLCVACGYDLRAASDRCPECGRTIA